LETDHSKNIFSFPDKRVTMEDALMAQLLGMGFGNDELAACHRELSAQGTYSLHTATEW